MEKIISTGSDIVDYLMGISPVHVQELLYLLDNGDIFKEGALDSLQDVFDHIAAKKIHKRYKGSIVNHTHIKSLTSVVPLCFEECSGLHCNRAHVAVDSTLGICMEIYQLLNGMPLFDGIPFELFLVFDRIDYDFLSMEKEQILPKLTLEKILDRASKRLKKELGYGVKFEFIPGLD